jgi:excisionase family DNA binding protein
MRATLSAPRAPAAVRAAGAGPGGLTTVAQYRDIIVDMSSRSTPPDRHTALYVRLPADEARKLDRAAHAVGAPKKDLVAGLVARYVDPDSDDGLRALRRLGAEAPGALPRRIVIEADEPPLVVGHHSFRPAELPEVLTPAQAAALLQVDEDAVLALAEAGTLPGRRIGDDWRFGRAALVAWLAGGDAQP